MIEKTCPQCSKGVSHFAAASDSVLGALELVRLLMLIAVRKAA